ncbi:hypothetical protein ARMSODRAFT_1043777 [Armillaria solidipes]|uniref:Uncharacterized protein n=1 Tax=Armillaria solidipes TaxID=1076256 RepID=A0A2H3CMZ5_9AGAR|nr:hypothetical protein ARMSODRAFT_1043777 [Armillaria solidipes]
MSLFSSQPTSSQREEYFCNAAEEEEDNKKPQQEERRDREDENYNPSSSQQYSSQSYTSESDDGMSSQPSDGPQGKENENLQREINNVVRGGDLEGLVAVLLGLIENGKSSQLEAAARLASKILGGRG